MTPCAERLPTRLVFLTLALASVASGVFGQPLASTTPRPYFEPTTDGALIGRGLNTPVRVDGREIHIAANGRDDNPLRLRFVGSRRDARVEGVDEQRGRVNYLRGDDRTKWRTNVPTYARGRARGVYRGVDIEYYESDGQLEYDLIVAPGADSRRIRLHANAPASVTAGGDVTFADSTVKIRRPVAFQVTGTARVDVDARFVLRRDGDVAIELGSYDRSRELVIDPVVLVSTRNAPAIITDIVSAHDGSTVIVGYTDSPSFPVVNAAFPSIGSQLGHDCYDGEGYYVGPCTDGFVMKLATDGSVLFATYFGANHRDLITVVALDELDNISIAGATYSLYPISNACVRRLTFDPPCGFFARFTSDGQTLEYVVAAVGLGAAGMFGVRDTGNLMLAGPTTIDEMDRAGNRRTIFTAGSGATITAATIGPSGDIYFGGYLYDDPAGTPDAYVIRMDAAGGVKYFSRLGGSSGEFVGDISVDATGTAWVSGTTISADFPFTVSAPAAPDDRPARAFLSRIDGAGTIVSARSFGEPNTTIATRLAAATDAVYAVACTTACTATRFDYDGRADGPYPVDSPLFAVDGRGRQIVVNPPNPSVLFTTYQWQEPARVRLTVDRTLPVRIGTPITWTAVGSGIPPFEYQWFVFDQSTGWHVARPYGPNASFTWTPGAGDVGTHAVQVWVRPAGSAVAQDSYAGSGFFEVIDTPITATLTTDATFPRAAGTTIRWTATASAVASLEYQFWLYDATQNAWRIVQDFSAANTFIWTPGSAGDYGVQVNVRSIGSPHPFDGAVNSNFPITITPPTQINITGFEPDVPTSLTAGTPMTWTATATGGVASLQYRFILFDEAAGWSELQPYGSRNSVRWTPLHAGTYGLQVWVRSAGSAALYDAWMSSATIAVSNATSPTVVTLRADRALPPTLGIPVTWTADAAGDGTPLEYKFLLYRGATGIFTTVRDFAPSPSWTWSGPLQKDIYAVAVWVRRQGSNAQSEAWSSSGYFTAISGPIQNLTLTSNQTFPLAARTPITWTASASGGTEALEYQFWLFDRQTSTWTIAQPWGNSPSWTWTPATSEFGTHAIQVWVRSQGSAAAFDAFVGSGHFVIVP